MSGARSCFLAGMIMAAAAGNEARGAEAATPAASAGNPAFSTELFAQLDKDAGTKNLFLSPYSISMAMAMTAQGAKGETRAQMDRVLHLDSANAAENRAALLDEFVAGAGGEERPFTLSVANAIWSDQTFPMQADFVATVQKQFRAEAETVDFLNAAEAGRSRINGWVQKQTNDKIKDLLPAGSVDKSTALVLTNAIYFKGAWQTPFRESATSDQPFHVDGAHDVTVPMMQLPSGTFCGYAETDDFQAVSLPYKTSDGRDGRDAVRDHLSMVVIVPKKVDGLAAVGKIADGG